MGTAASKDIVERLCEGRPGLPDVLAPEAFQIQPEAVLGAFVASSAALAQAHVQVNTQAEREALLFKMLDSCQAHMDGVSADRPVCVFIGSGPLVMTGQPEPAAQRVPADTPVPAEAPTEQDTSMEVVAAAVQSTARESSALPLPTAADQSTARRPVMQLPTTGRQQRQAHSAAQALQRPPPEASQAGGTVHGSRRQTVSSVSQSDSASDSLGQHAVKAARGRRAQPSRAKRGASTQAHTTTHTTTARVTRATSAPAPASKTNNRRPAAVRPVEPTATVASRKPTPSRPSRVPTQPDKATIVSKRIRMEDPVVKQLQLRRSEQTAPKPALLLKGALKRHKPAQTETDDDGGSELQSVAPVWDQRAGSPDYSNCGGGFDDDPQQEEHASSCSVPAPEWRVAATRQTAGPPPEATRALKAAILTTGAGTAAALQPQREASKPKHTRDRVEWSSAEVDALIDGVRSLGKGSWLKILSEKKGAFQQKRTAESLKDKWRTMEAKARGQQAAAAGPTATAARPTRATAVAEGKPSGPLSRRPLLPSERHVDAAKPSKQATAAALKKTSAPADEWGL